MRRTRGLENRGRWEERGLRVSAGQGGRLLAREFGPDAKAVEGLFSAVEADADVDNALSQLSRQL